MQEVSAALEDVCLNGAGEIEMQRMGARLRKRFSDLFEPRYHPEQHALISTQVMPASHHFSNAVASCRFRSRLHMHDAASEWAWLRIPCGGQIDFAT